MLTALTINNVVLIEKLDLPFSPGFCALTGETGAGKSILLDALGLALGGRSDAGLVRKGADQASVSAEFQIDKKHPVLDLLKEQGLEGDTSLILRRIVGTDGRSRAFINDQPVSVALLRRAGEMMVEIHGQFETQGLLDQSTHRALLDDYAGIDEAGLRAAWNAWKSARDALQSAQDQAAKARAEEDYLRGAVEDLEALSPEAGEDQKLATLREKLMRRDQMLENFKIAYDGAESAEGTLNKVSRALERTGDDARGLIEAIDRALSEIRDVMADVQSQSADLEEGEHDLASIDDRLHDLKSQARKHGCAPDDLANVLADLKKRLSLAERQEEVLDDLTRAVDTARKAYIKTGDAVRDLRRKSAQKLDRLVAKELPPLKLEKATFTTSVSDLDEKDWGAHGMDDVRFLVATNPGSAPGPLDKIASGGEMSRFMLALKVVTAAAGGPGTYIFDEVDTGIGGSTAAAVGERLARLAENRQILVVTHAPQVAARAHDHWIVTKSGVKDVTTKVIPLAKLAERREEIARMLSGAQITDEARAAATKLLETGT